MAELDANTDALIADAAQRRGVPVDAMRAIAEQESGGDSSALNKETGARGLYQFIPETARRYGIDPTDPAQAAEAAAQMFKENLDRFGGDESKAIAAHFGGPDTSKWGPKTEQYVKDVRARMRAPADDTGEPQSGPADTVVEASTVPKQTVTRVSSRPPREDTSGWVDLGFSDQAPAAPQAKTGFLSDVAKVGASGLTQLGTAVGRGLEFAGDKLGSQGTSELGASVQDYWRAATDKLIASTSPETARALSNPILNEDFSLGDTPVASAFWGAVQAAPAMFASGGAGKALVGGAFKGLTAVAASTRLAGILTKLGMAPEAAAATGARVATAAGTGVAYGAPTGVIFGLLGGAATEEAIKAKPLNELAQSPAFQAEYQKTPDTLPDQRRGELARESVARQAADQATIYSMALNGSIGLLTGGGIFGKWNRGGFEGGLTRRALTGAALDQAAVQPMMLGQTAIQNAAIQEYANPNQSLTEGMPAAFGSGLSFAPFGAVGGISHPRAASAGPRPAVESEQAARARAMPQEPAGGGEEPPPGAPPADPITQANQDLASAVQANDRGAIDAAQAELARAQQAGAAATQEGDIGRKDGLPFASRIAAIAALKRQELADSHEIVALAPNSYVLRPKAEPEAKAPSENPLRDVSDEALAALDNYGSSIAPADAFAFGDQKLMRQAGLLREASEDRRQGERAQAIVDVGPLLEERSRRRQEAAANEGAKPETAPGVVPDSLLSAFPDMPQTEQGVIPVSAMRPEEQAAVRKAGLVTEHTNSEGGAYEGVDPEKLWPLRQAAASREAASGTGPTAEDKARGVENRASFEERVAADIQESDPEKAATLTAHAAGLRKAADDLRAGREPDKEALRPLAKPSESGLDKATGEVVPEPLPGMLQGDIAHPDGKPFANRNMAHATLVKKRLGGRYDPVKIAEGQYVLRPRRRIAALPTVDAAAHEAATSPSNELPSPSAAQKEAGNYRKGHTTVGGIEVSIENPAGSKRRPEWPTLKSHYGYAVTADGAPAQKGPDKEHNDLFIKPGTPLDYKEPVYVVDQRKPGTGRFDETKAMLGWSNAYAAKKAYMENYPPDWEGLQAITPTTMEGYKAWLKSGDTTRPFAESAKAAPAPEARSEKQRARDEELRRAAKGRRTVRPETDSVITAITKLGGLKMSERSDITRDTKGSNPRLPFIGALFSDSPRARGIDEMAQALAQRGYDYLTPQEMDDVDGGVGRLREMIEDELGGSPHYSARYDHSAAAEAFETRLVDDAPTPAEEKVAGIENLAPASQELARAVKDEMLDAAEASPAVIGRADWSTMTPAERDAELNDIFGKTESHEIQPAAGSETPQAPEAGAQARGGGREEAGQSPPRENAGPERRGEFTLAGESNAEALAREEREAKAAPAAEDKAAADRAVDHFALAPPEGAVTQRPENSEKNQRDLLSASSESPETKPAQRESSAAKGLAKAAAKEDRGTALSEPEAQAYNSAVKEADRDGYEKELSADRGSDLGARQEGAEKSASRAPEAAAGREPLVVFRKTGTVDSSVTSVHSAEDAASFFADMRHSPREVFTVLALNARGKILGTARMFAGALNQASVYPQEIAKLIYAVPGAKRLWIAHNHPSGIAEPSRADKYLTQAIGKSFGRDLGITLDGHVIVAGRKAALLNEKGDLERQFSLPQGERKHRVPVVDRIVVREPDAESRPTLSSPWAAREAVERDLQGKPGILWLDAQKRVLRADPLEPGQFEKLRGTGEFAEFMRTVAEVNPAHAIINATPETLKGAENLGRALSTQDVRLLDLFSRDAQGALVSHSERGMLDTTGTFSSETQQRDEKRMGPRARLDVGLYQSAVNRLPTDQILEKIRTGSASEFNRELASKLLGLGVDPKIVVPPGGMPERVDADGKQFITRGEYSTANDTVKLYTAQAAERTVLHETVHAATIYAIDQKTPAGKEMVGLYESVRNSGEIDPKQYGMKDVYEFVAEGYSNPDFQTQLGMVEVTASGKVRKAWDALVDIARRVLGLGPNRHTALDEFLLVGGDLMYENAVLRHDAALRKSGIEPPARTLGLETEADHHEEPIRGAPGVKFNDLVGKAHDIFDAVANNDKRVNWWRRTLGTPYDKANAVDKNGRPRLPGYKRVYGAVQDFLRDQQMIATDAMDRAPDLLPRLANLGEVFKRGPEPDELRRAAGAIFDGTLVDKRVYSDAELQRKGLSPKAIRLYRQARAALDQSLDDHTASIAALLVQDIGLPKSVIKAARDEPARAGKIYQDALQPIIREAQGRMDAARDNKTRTLAEWDAEQAATLKDLKGQELADARRNIEEKRKSGVADLDRQIKAAEQRFDNVNAVSGALLKQFGHAATLKRQGYAPLMRFGEHTVYAYDPTTGEQHSFSAHDTQLGANREAAALGARYPGAEIVQGIMSHDNEHLYEGITPEALKLFAQRISELPDMPEARAIQDALYQDYLKLVASDRSPLKRMIYRKGVPGYSEDLHKVLSAFVASNARAASRNYHGLEMKEALANIPKQHGDVLKDAAKLVRYVMEPQEEAAALRGLLFFNFIGGSVVSALNNLTQVPLLTTPHLMRYADAGKVSSALGFGAQVALGKTPGSAGLRQAMARAKREGLLAPLEAHQLYAEQSPGVLAGRTGSLAYRKFVHLWGSLFQAAEQFNRRATFAAAYQIAGGMTPAELRKAGAEDAYGFAERAVDETQFVYNKGNRPNWFRGPFGATLGTFKSFTVNTLEFLNRLPAKQKAVALALLAVGSGMKGLPFAQDLEDIVDTLGQMLGYNTNSDAALHEFAAQTLGDTAGDVLLRGASAVPGFPGDFSNRIGFGRIIPGLAAIKPSTKDRLKALTDVVGPAGSQLKQGLDALAAAQEGRYGAAAMALAPKAVRQFGQGLQEAEKGYAVDTQGRRTVDVTTADAAAQMLGLTPYNVAKSALEARHVGQSVGFQRMTAARLIDGLAQARLAGDQEQERQLREQVAEWNAKNPDATIRVTAGQINARVRQLRADRATRLTKSAPKSMRAEVRSQLQ